MVPCSGLPAATRSAGVSRPWSAELRTMWVSGSLIRSSTWRSSSVSAPCISSSICLSSSPDRSRTIRGSFCQALPIGCIRVFMTPSCNSAVTLESRCSGTLNSVSSLRREISKSWLRVSTSSETIVIRCSSVSTLTRIDWLATLSASWTSAASGPAAFLDGLAFGSLAARGAAAGAVCGAAAGAGAARRWGGLPDNGCGGGRLDFGRGLAEGALEVIERDFAGTQRPFQHLRRPKCPPRWSRACPRVAAGATGGAGDHRHRRSFCFRRRRAFGHRMQLPDQVFVGALGLGLGRLEAGAGFP